jgi:CheY-like chemotaxis protein
MEKKKILLIDDDLDWSESTKLFLESNNYKVDTAINSKIGIEKLKSTTPDLLILDIMMDSNLEGFNFLNELKSNDALKKIPVVMNSGMAKAIGVNMRAAIEEIDFLPSTRFVDKTGDWDELIIVIKELLGEEI